jgi:hypothetical protein
MRQLFMSIRKAAINLVLVTLLVGLAVVLPHHVQGVEELFGR